MSKAGKDLILCNVLCLQIPKALDMWPAGSGCWPAVATLNPGARLATIVTAVLTASA